LIDMGYASAAAFILFFVIFAFTLIQWWLRKRWVYNED
jgi:multiple sugar transport system permease protein